MAVLTITYKAVDETAGASQQVEAGIKGVGDAADEAKGQGTGFFGGMLQAAGGFLAANVIGQISGQITGFVGDSISSAREARQLMAQTEQVIKTTGGAAGMSAEQVADLASSLSAAAGKSLFGDDQIQGAENVLLKYRELKGLVPGVTQLAIDMAQRLGTDPAAAADTLGRALQKPFEAEAKLAKQGIVLTDQQKAMLETMKAAGDTAGAQKFLIDELNKTYGGSAQAAADADGGMAQFKDRLGEAGETLATALLPVLDALVGLLNDYVMPVVEELAANAVPFLTDAFAKIQPILQVVIDAFGQAGGAGDLLGVQVTALGKVWEALAPVVDAVVKVIGQVVTVVFGDIQAFLAENGDDIQATIDEVWSAIGEIVGLAVELIKATIIPAFEAVAKFLGDHSEEIQAVLKAAWTIIKATIDTALTLIKGILKAALQIIHGDWEGAWTTIREMFSRIWQNIKTILSAEVDAAKAILSMAWDAIKGTVQSAWDGIKNTISGAWEDIKSGVAQKIGDLKDTIRRLPEGLADVGRAVVNAIWDGIKAKWDDLVDWFKRKLQELRDQLPFSEPKDANSPMRGLGKAGEALVTNIQRGIEGAAPLSVDAPLIGTTRTGALAGAGAQGRAGGRGGEAVVRLSIDDRGLVWLKQLIKVEVVAETDRISRIADARGRTR